ncbi:MAG: hypothetical protein WC861_07105 [Candidatus Micrarchaeia archaeon]
MGMKEGKETDFEESEAADNWENGFFRPDKNEEPGNGRLIAKSQWGYLIKALGIFALLLGLWRIYLALDPRQDAMQQLYGASLFFAMAFMALVLGTDIEIRRDGERGEITLVESRMLFGRSSRKYLFAQIAKVVYVGPTRQHPDGQIQFEARDGKKFRCNIYGSYVPKEHEFGSAKVEYRYGPLRAMV